MAFLPSEFPTPEQLEARFRIVQQLYDLGVALREARFVDKKFTEASTREGDRVSDVRPDWPLDSEAQSGQKPAQ